MIPGATVSPKEYTIPWRDILALGWAVFYVGFATLAQYEEFQRYVLWMGAPPLAAGSILLGVSKRERPTTPVMMYAAFVLWALMCVGVVEHPDAFWEQFRRIVQNAVLLVSVSLVVRRSGRLSWFYTAFLIAGLANGILGEVGPSGSFDVGDPDEPVRAQGITENPNQLGFFEFLGIVGCLGLLGKAKSVRAWIVIGAAATYQFFVLIGSASRGALLSLTFVTVLYPIICHWHSLRKRPLAAAGSYLLVGIFILGLNMALSGSYLGERIANVDERERGSRGDLIDEALDQFVDSPIVGVGLNQFRHTSISKQEAHSEYGELLAGTGIVGAALVFGAYGLLLVRLRKAVVGISDKAHKFDANFCLLLTANFFVSAVYRPNFVLIDTMFLFAIVIGASARFRDRSNVILGLERSSG